MAKVNGKFVPPNKIFMTEKQKQFVKDNFKTMTNEQIAEATKLSKTYVRMYAYSIGLQRELIVHWTDEQNAFFIENWQFIGNVEMAKILNETYPGKKVFTKRNISKKLTNLKLKRTAREEDDIRERNRLNGMWGPPMENKSLPVLKKIWIQINPKMRVELKPNQLPAQLLEKYKHLVY